jgi:hypothetical protein
LARAAEDEAAAAAATVFFNREESLKATVELAVELPSEEGGARVLKQWKVVKMLGSTVTMREIGADGEEILRRAGLKDLPNDFEFDAAVVEHAVAKARKAAVQKEQDEFEQQRAGVSGSGVAAEAVLLDSFDRIRVSLGRAVADVLGVLKRALNRIQLQSSRSTCHANQSQSE